MPATPGGTWGRIDFLGSSESTLTYCNFERANASGIIRGRSSEFRLDPCRFIDVNVQMVDLIDTSCIIQYCEFDDIGSGELLHFSDMPADGHALIAYNRFGTTGGYNDIIDFTGGNRPGPIARLIDNAPPIELSDLADGTYTVEVLGRNSAGDWQEAPTGSKSWTVQTASLDSDSDGMPDDYEMAYGLNPGNPDDAAFDLDGDGSTNFEEFVAGTEPTNRASVLMISRLFFSGADLDIAFEAVAGKSYQLQRSAELTPGSWSAVETILSASGEVQVLTDVDASLVARRFYRIVTPAP